MNNAVSFLSLKRVVLYTLILLAAIGRTPNLASESATPDAPAIASDFSEDFSYQNTGTSIVVTGCNNDSVKITVPARIEGLPVTTIGEKAFEGLENLEFVELPDSVETIEARAFCNCSSLTSITLPEGITKIENWAFFGCTNLTSVTLSEGLKKIGWGTFCTCTSLTSITLPKGLEKIGEDAFFHCSSLSSVTLPEGLEEIEQGAFSFCSDLTSVTLPEGIKGIGEYAFPHETTLYVPPQSVTEKALRDAGYSPRPLEK